MVALLQLLHTGGSVGIGTQPGDIVVGAPLALALLQDAVAHACAEGKLPLAGFLVALDDVIKGQLAAVAFNDVNGADDGFGVGEVIAVAALAGVLVEGDVVDQLVLSQNNGVRVDDIAALAPEDNGLGTAALRLFGIGLALA